MQATHERAPCMPHAGRSRDERRQMEDELRDPKNFAEYFVPRPIRQWILWGSGASALVAALLSLGRLSEAGGPQDLAVNAGGKREPLRSQMCQTPLCGYTLPRL